MTNPIAIIIVEKSGALKSLSIKDFKEDELFKKCGFKIVNSDENLYYLNKKK